MEEPQETFGQWVDRKATKLELNDYELHTAVGLYGPGRKVFHQKSATRLRHGGQVNLNSYLVARLIELLAEDEEEAERAWKLSGVLPPDATPADIRELLTKIAGRRRRADREVPLDAAPAGTSVRADSERTGDCKEPPAGPVAA